MTTTTADPFSTDRLPEVPSGQLPPELLDDSPFAQLGAEFLRLSGEYSAAVAELHGLARQQGQAAKADQLALSHAMRSGKPDPGDPATVDLTEKVASQRRRIEGLADATHGVYAELRDALEGSDGERWALTLDSDLESSGTRIEKLLADLEDALEQVESPARAVRWLRRVRAASDSNNLATMTIGNSFPGLTGGETTINVYNNPAPREVVFDAIRATVEDVRTR